MPSYYAKAEVSIKPCKGCGGPMAIVGDRNKVFCSPSCYNKYERKYNKEHQQAIKRKYRQSAKGIATLEAYKLKLQNQTIEKKRSRRIFNKIKRKGINMTEQNHKKSVTDILESKMHETPIDSKLDGLKRQMVRQGEDILKRMQELKEQVIRYKAETDSLRMTKVNQFRRYQSDLKEVEFDVATLKNQVKAINDKIGGYGGEIK